MSMNDYGFTAYGVVLNDIVDDDLLADLAENDEIASQFSFTGEAFKMRDNGCPDWGDQIAFDDNTVYYVELPKYPEFFKAAYPNMKALMADMARAVRRVKGLPKLTQKQIRDNLRKIEGTYCG